MVAKDLGTWRAWRDRLDSWLFPGRLRVWCFRLYGLGNVNGNWDSMGKANKCLSWDLRGIER